MNDLKLRNTRKGVLVPRMKEWVRFRREICIEYGYRGWSHARVEAPKDEVSAILHEVIDRITDRPH